MLSVYDVGEIKEVMKQGNTLPWVLPRLYTMIEIQSEKSGVSHIILVFTNNL